MKSGLTILFFSLALTAAAQTETTPVPVTATDELSVAVEHPEVVPLAETSGDVSPMAPLVRRYRDYSLYDPYGFGYLHEGFNAQFSLFANVGFGKHAPRGVGFGQSAALTYVHTFSPKLSAVVGLYGTHYNWGGTHSTDVSVMGMLAYRPNDRLTLYAYATKSFMSEQAKARMWQNWYAPTMGDRLGVAADYKFSEKFRMSMAFEYRYDNVAPFYNGVMGTGLRPMNPLGW